MKPMICAGAPAPALSTPSSTASLNPLRKSKSDPVFCLSAQNVRCRSSAMGISSQNGVHHFKSIYGNYLFKAGIPKEIASNFETLLQTYCNFMNGYAKHHDKTELNVLEYLMYQTGNIIRLLITLKQAEPVTENEVVL